MQKSHTHRGVTITLPASAEREIRLAKQFRKKLCEIEI